MIQQKVLLAKLRTDDGNWDVSDKPDLYIGMAFWIQCNTYEVKPFKLGEGKLLCVKTEAGFFVPVDVLKYTSDFRIIGV